MTVENPTGAASHATVDWHHIDWQQVHQNVRRLQGRIVKACQAGRWGTVQAWQHRLTHSLSGRAIAGKRVTENPGKRTPGRDGTLWDTPEKKAQALHTAASGLSTDATAACVHPKKPRHEAPTRHVDHARPSDAGLIPPRCGPPSLKRLRTRTPRGSERSDAPPTRYNSAIQY